MSDLMRKEWREFEKIEKQIEGDEGGHTTSQACCESRVVIRAHSHSYNRWTQVSWTINVVDLHEVIISELEDCPGSQSSTTAAVQLL